MTTELHLTYLCVPPAQTVAYLDWGRFQNALGTLVVSREGGARPMAAGVQPG